MRTSVDERKEKADFLLEQIHNYAIIKIQNGSILSKINVLERYDNGCVRISKRTLSKIQKKYSWATNF